MHRLPSSAWHSEQACPAAALYVQRDPGHYDVPSQATTDELDRWLRDRLLMGCLRELAEHGMVRCCAWHWGLIFLPASSIW